MERERMIELLNEEMLRHLALAKVSGEETLSKSHIEVADALYMAQEMLGDKQ